MSKRDYYEVLEVSRDADADAIKKAYRAMAMKHHPDRNKNDVDAEAKFTEATVAYEILSDPEKRARYDNFGHDGPTESVGFGGFGGFGSMFNMHRWNNGNIPRSGEDVVVIVPMDLKDILVETEYKLQVPSDDFCTHCSGKGLKSGKTKTSCKSCNGTGVVSQNRMQGNVRIHVQQPCGMCHGQGSVILPEHKCEHCVNGKVTVEKEIVVKLPAGMSPEYSMRMPGLGKSGSNGGPRGDLFVQVNIKSHERFTRDVDNLNDLLLDLPITFVQACLGAKIPVEMLDGSIEEVNMPPYTQNGHIISLKKQGVPSLATPERGTLYIRLNVSVPASLTDKQKEILEQFNKLDIERSNDNAQKKNHSEKRNKSAKSVEKDKEGV